MTKKIAAALFCVLLALSLAACKGNIGKTENKLNVTTTKAGSVAESKTTSTTALITAVTTTQETTTQKKEENTTAVTTTKKETTTQKQTTTIKQTTTQKTTTTTKKQTTTQKQTTTKKAVTTTKANYNVNSSNSNVKDIYNLVNQERSKNGLSKYAYRNDLQNAANTRAKEIVEKFSHTRPNGTACFSAIKEAGVSYSTAGENIGKTTGTNADMMSWWMNSTDHKNNILSSKYTGIVVGCYEKDGTKYFVQLFVG